MEDLAGRLQVSDRIVWTGSLSGPRKWAALRYAEALVLTSHTENFGIVVVEALAVGTPVLVSKRVNIWPEVVAAGAGYAEENTVEGSVRLLRRWQDTSHADRARMSESGKAVFQQRCEISLIAKNLEGVLRECAYGRVDAG